MSIKSTLSWNSIDAFEWKGLYWIARPLWGNYHPNDSLTWYDEEQPEILDNGNLYLPFEYKLKYGRPIGRSSVRCISQFKYGTFEWTFILPKGRWQWPALWLASDEGWPPEIDCLEGWSGDDPNYVKRVLFKNVKPTMHWSTNADEKIGEHKSETKNNNLRCIIKGDGKVNTAKVVWTPNYVDVFYNGIKIKRFKDPEMLKHFNKEGYMMHPIMSAGPYGKEWKAYGSDPDLFDAPKVYNHLEILDFKYTPLK